MNAELVELVWRRAHSCCEYCRISQQQSLLPFEIDHIIAKKHGGRTVAGKALTSAGSNRGPED
jgi:hypothetical protein